MKDGRKPQIRKDLLNSILFCLLSLSPFLSFSLSLFGFFATHLSSLLSVASWMGGSMRARLRTKQAEKKRLACFSRRHTGTHREVDRLADRIRLVFSEDIFFSLRRTDQEGKKERSRERERRSSFSKGQKASRALFLRLKFFPLPDHTHGTRGYTRVQMGDPSIRLVLSRVLGSVSLSVSLCLALSLVYG